MTFDVEGHKWGNTSGEGETETDRYTERNWLPRNLFRYVRLRTRVTREPCENPRSVVRFVGFGKSFWYTFWGRKIGTAGFSIRTLTSIESVRSG